MTIIIFIALLIAGGLLNLIIKPRAKYIYSLATGYIILALFVSVGSWLFYFAGIKNTLMINMLSFILNWGKHLGHLILGYLIVCIFFELRKKVILPDNYQLKKIVRSTLWAVSILTGNSFLIATVGKAEDMAEMIAFFKTSGYAIWFLYFIMTAETLGGLGVLLHFKLKTGPLAAAGLLLIMGGAVYTHWHNGDPFSDSYAAVTQIITLCLMLVIYYFEKQGNSVGIKNATTG
jgi:putative oxidoreductase